MKGRDYLMRRSLVLRKELEMSREERFKAMREGKSEQAVKLTEEQIELAKREMARYVRNEADTEEIFKSNNVRKITQSVYVEGYSRRYAYNYPNLVVQGYARFEDWMKDNPNFIGASRAHRVAANISSFVYSSFNREVGLVEYLSAITDNKPCYSNYYNELNKVLDKYEDNGFEVKRLGQDDEFYAVVIHNERIQKRFKNYCNVPEKYLNNGIEWVVDYCNKHEETAEYMRGLKPADKAVAALALVLKPLGEDCEEFLKYFLADELEDLKKNRDLFSKDSKLLVRNLLETVRIDLFGGEDKRELEERRIINAANYESLLRELSSLLEKDELKAIVRRLTQGSELVESILDDINNSTSNRRLVEIGKELKYHGVGLRGTDVKRVGLKPIQYRGLSW